MSHITTVKTKLKDEQILRQALKKIGYHIQDGGIIVGGYISEKGKSVEIIAKKNEYRIGFKRSNNHYYEISADWEVQEKTRANIINEIFQAYSSEKVIHMARLKGYSVMQNRAMQNDQIEIILRKVV
jgi:hypothetical protein